MGIVNIVLSRAKWAKVWLLIREKTTVVSYLSGRYLGYGTMDLQNPSLDSLRTVSSVAQRAPESAAHPVYFQWKYTARVAVPHPVFTGSVVRYGQDEMLDQQHLSTEFDYRMAVIQGASLASNGVSHVTVYDANDCSLTAFSYVKYGRDRRRNTSSVRHLPITRNIAGLTLNLFGNIENVSGNIGHWIIDGVAQVFLAQREFALEDIDHFLVPAMRFDFQRTVLNGLGIPNEKILEIDSLECFRFECLICTSAPRGHSSGNVPGWLIDGYRKSFLPAQASPAGKRIYISRRDAGSRKFINEDEIESLLKSHGFESIEMSAFDYMDKVALFANAEIIIGLTGAGLTNLMFCNKGAHVIELLPSSYVSYFYTSMAGYLELDYRWLIFDSCSMLSSMNKYYGNLYLDVSLLKNALKGLV